MNTQHPLPTSHPPSDDPAALRSELEQLRLSEARFRARLVADFAQREGADRAHLDRIDALERLLAERDTSIHNLNLELAALVRGRTTDAQARVRLAQALHADLEWFVHRLAEVTGEAEALRRPPGLLERLGLRRWKGRIPGAGGAPLEPIPNPAPARPFVYYLHTSPYRLFRTGTFTVRGWAWPSDGGSVTGMRVRIGAHEFIGRHGLEDADALAQHGHQPANPRPGFEIDIDLPPGRHLLSLEAQVAHAAWFSILTTPVWRVP